METPSVGLNAAIAATKALWGGYSGYSGGKLRNSDQALRQEVRRRTLMVRSHVEVVHDQAHYARRSVVRDAAKSALEACDELARDAQLATSVAPSSDHDGVVELPRKVLKQLVEHDLVTLEKLVASTRRSNAVEHADPDQEDASLAGELRHLRQDLTGARNHFRERNMLIDGFVRR